MYLEFQERLLLSPSLGLCAHCGIRKIHYVLANVTCSLYGIQIKLDLQGQRGRERDKHLRMSVNNVDGDLLRITRGRKQA